MSVCGIIAEFNPLHNGHKHLIDKAKAEGYSVVCTISGNFVQRGEAAIYSKTARAAAAISAGADMVLEMPTVYSMSTAQNFALYGVLSLYNAGCDTLFFGSESGDTSALLKAADILLSEDYKAELSKAKSTGETFAASRQKAAEKCGVKKGLLKMPNDNLAIEYILAAKSKGLKMEFKAVKREGALHDSTPCGDYSSASYLRKFLIEGKIHDCKRYMPQEAHVLLNEAIADIKYAERAVLALLRTKQKEDFKNLPDLSEGLENRLFEAISEANSLEELYGAVKTKRYTLSRIRRLVINAALGFDNSFFLKPPPYSRVLGSRRNFSLPKQSALLFPIVSRVSEIEALGETAQKLFKTECIAGDFYGLCFEKTQSGGMEYKMKYIK